MGSQHLVAAGYELLAVEAPTTKESRHREDRQTTTERSKRSTALPRSWVYYNLLDSTYLTKDETRASKKDNSGDESMPSRTTVQSTDNVVGTCQILTMKLQMQQEAARDRREDAKIAKQTEKIRKSNSLLLNNTSYSSCNRCKHQISPHSRRHGRSKTRKTRKL